MRQEQPKGLRKFGATRFHLLLDIQVSFGFIAQKINSRHAWDNYFNFEYHACLVLKLSTSLQLF
jgi:hypothetical protein